MIRSRGVPTARAEKWGLRVRIHHPQHGEFCTVAQAGKLLQSVLRFDRQAVQLPDNEIYYVIRVTLGVNTIQIPRPSPFAVIEGEQRLFGQRGNELNGKKWIATGLVMNQLRQRGGMLRFAMKSIRNQSSQVFAG